MVMWCKLNNNFWINKNEAPENPYTVVISVTQRLSRSQGPLELRNKLRDALRMAVLQRRNRVATERTNGI
jgi:hypothetical protein